MTRRKPKPRAKGYRDFETFEELLQWTSERNRHLIEIVIGKIKSEFPDTFGKHRGRYYCFYRREPTAGSLFAALRLAQNWIKVRIRLNPSTFQDDRKWTGKKKYPHWFFSIGEEVEFQLEDEKQLDYAISLIEQSYKLVTPP